MFTQSFLYPIPNLQFNIPNLAFYAQLDILSVSSLLDIGDTRILDIGDTGILDTGETAQRRNLRPEQLFSTTSLQNNVKDKVF